MSFPPSCLRLFLSADIVGSTAFKQSVSDGEQRQVWLQAIAAFFSGLDQSVRYEWEASLKIAGDEIKAVNQERPRFWKAAGDEVIYVLEINSPLQPLFAVMSFRRAVEQYRKVLHEASKKLDLKATAWLAGFPVNNAEIVLGGTRSLKITNPQLEGWWAHHLYRRYLFSSSPVDGETLDFIGPQMDLGFRLSRYSTPRRMMVSVDLALMLLDTYRDNWAEHFNVKDKIYFDDTETLKGVLAGTPYPLLWLDSPVENRLNAAEDKIRNRAAPNAEDTVEYCRAFISQVGEQHMWIMSPFILKDGEIIYGYEPEAHRSEVGRQRQDWQRIERDVIPDTEPVDDGDPKVAETPEDVKKMINWLLTGKQLGQ